MAARDDHDYLPGFTRDVLLPLYDPLIRVAGTPRMHHLLVSRAGIGPRSRVLDVGTGTGELALAIAREHPDVEVVGIDPDPLALRRARRKAARRCLGDRVQFEPGYGERLAYDDSSFDHVVSAFAYHHLDEDAKVAALFGIARVLRSGGRCHLVDFGGAISSSDGWVARRLLASAQMRGNLGDAVVAGMRSAGFADACEVTHRVSRRLGRVTLWGARAGAAAAGR